MTDEELDIAMKKLATHWNWKPSEREDLLRRFGDIDGTAVIEAIDKIYANADKVALAKPSPKSIRQNLPTLSQPQRQSDGTGFDFATVVRRNNPSLRPSSDAACVVAYHAHWSGRDSRRAELERRRPQPDERGPASRDPCPVHALQQHDSPLCRSTRRGRVIRCKAAGRARGGIAAGCQAAGMGRGRIDQQSE